jgi:NADH-quinone oxidoreductase subunit F
VKPPFPADRRPLRCPTIVNNVETMSVVPLILEKGATWFASSGREERRAEALLRERPRGAPGHLRSPDGPITLRDLIYGEGYGQGIKGGTPAEGGDPGRIVDAGPAPERDRRPMDLESLAKAGAHWDPRHHRHGRGDLHGLRGRNLAFFYKDESCGKCTPCREGTGWILAS